MNTIIIITTCFYLVANTFAFRFQRTTLNISRAIFNKGSSNVQMLLSPTWLGILGWLVHGLVILISILVWNSFRYERILILNNRNSLIATKFLYSIIMIFLGSIVCFSYNYLSIALIDDSVLDKVYFDGNYLMKHLIAINITNL